MSGSKIIKSIFGSRNQRVLKRLGKVVKKINALEPSFQGLSDESLKAKTAEFKQRLEAGETVDQLLPEAFATVREAALRVLGLRPFDVQLIGGMVLHEGNIAEMRTGEGKTLSATLPSYLNALTGKGVHIITVNDYLASRDAKWMEPIYNFLGMTVGIIFSDMPPADKKAAYAADVVYGTNNEFGFDYLRDNMVFALEDKVQRELHFAVVDEVDSILIDEARTPLIISGPAEDNPALYTKIDKVIPQLIRQPEADADGDYSVDEKNKQVFLTEAGHSNVEKILVTQGMLQASETLYDVSNISLLHHVNAALRAHALFQKDVDYIVENNEVVIIDEHTGRKMVGRRWSEGLHQAVEAKEGVRIQAENQTMASITFQNYFRLYDKLSGMTGTADTEAFEFQQIYGLEVLVIPTNKPMMRNDQPDFVFLTAEAKYKAIIEDVKKCVEKGQPVLVGTASIDTSEYLATLLRKAKIKHQVLNAKFHEKEASIIAQAGVPGAVTIATNMAGRGTDIVLGGNVKAEIEALEAPTDAQVEKLKADWKVTHEAVLASGGLRIIGSERHESRRIDNQLRGRSGRQGDPGSSRFYLSIEDNLIRIFAADRLSTMLRRFGRMKDDDVIESGMLSKIIESAQRKVEGFNFDMRKQLLEYDDVANDQRKIIYGQRAELLSTENVADTMDAIKLSVADAVIDQFVPPESMEEQWDLPALQAQLKADFGLSLDLLEQLEQQAHATAEDLKETVHQAIDAIYQEKETLVTAEMMRKLEKSIMLQSLDQHWREHLAAMDHLRQGIHLRGYAQKDPKQEYKREAYNLFTNMTENIKSDVLSTIITFQPQPEDLRTLEGIRRAQTTNMNIQYHHDEAPLNAEIEQAVLRDETAENALPFIRGEVKVGRNALCPCGSGKKYKQCHGKIT